MRRRAFGVSCHRCKTFDVTKWRTRARGAFPLEFVTVNGVLCASVLLRQAQGSPADSPRVVRAAGPDPMELRCSAFRKGAPSAPVPMQNRGTDSPDIVGGSAPGRVGLVPLSAAHLDRRLRPTVPVSDRSMLANGPTVVGRATPDGLKRVGNIAGFSRPGLTSSMQDRSGRANGPEVLRARANATVPVGPGVDLLASLSSGVLHDASNLIARVDVVPSVLRPSWGGAGEKGESAQKNEESMSHHFVSPSWRSQHTLSSEFRLSREKTWERAVNGAGTSGK